MSKPVSFARRLRDLRTAAGLSVQALAEAAGLNRQAVYKLEAGEREPNWATVQAIAAALGKTPNDFTSRHSC